MKLPVWTKKLCVWLGGVFSSQASFWWLNRWSRGCWPERGNVCLRMLCIFSGEGCALFFLVLLWDPMAPCRRRNALGFRSTMPQVSLLSPPAACILFGSENIRGGGAGWADFFVVFSSHFESCKNCYSIKKKLTVEFHFSVGIVAPATFPAACSRGAFRSRHYFFPIPAADQFTSWCSRMNDSYNSHLRVVHSGLPCSEKKTHKVTVFWNVSPREQGRAALGSAASCLLERASIQRWPTFLTYFKVYCLCMILSSLLSLRFILFNHLTILSFLYFYSCILLSNRHTD